MTPRELASRVFEAWRKLAHVIGVVNTHLLLFLVYWLLFGPVALALKVFGKDYLRRRARGQVSYWLDREPEVRTVERAAHPF